MPRTTVTDALGNVRAFDVNLGAPAKGRTSISMRLLAAGKYATVKQLKALAALEASDVSADRARLAALEAAVFSPSPAPPPPSPGPFPPQPAPPQPPAPASTVWDYTGLDPLNQLDEGECGGWGSATRALCTPNPIPWTPDLLVETEANLPERIYVQALVNDGTIPAGATPSPQDEQAGASPDAIAKANIDLGLASAVHWCTTLDEIDAAYELGPVDLAIPWTTDMFTPDPQTRVLSVTGSVAGGHWITSAGRDAQTGLHTLVQTWGPGWAPGILVDGICFLTDDGVTTLLAGAGDPTNPGTAASFTK